MVALVYLFVEVFISTLVKGLHVTTHQYRTVYSDELK